MHRFYEWQLQLWCLRLAVSSDEGRILYQTPAFCAYRLAAQSGLYFSILLYLFPLSYCSLFDHPTLVFQLNTQVLLHHY